MAIAFVTEARLKLKMGASRWIEFFDDDNDGVADAAAVTEVVNDSNADIESRLMGKGFTQERLEDMAGDSVLSRIGAEIAMGYAGERRPEWLNAEGFGPFEKLREKAYRNLAELAKGRIRIPAEDTAGANTQVGGRLSRNQASTGHFVFANTHEGRTRGSRGPGGF